LLENYSGRLEKGIDAVDVLDRVLTQMDLDFVGNGRHKVLAEELLADDKAVLLDVRTAEEAASVKLGFIHHLRSVNIPLHLLPELFEQVPRDKTVGIFCPHSVRAAIAYTFLRAHGYDTVYVIDGGYAALVEEARPGKVLARLNAVPCQA